MMKKIAVLNSHSTYFDQSKHLANQLNLPFIKSNQKTYPFLLQFTEKGLMLSQSGEKSPGEIYIDFADGKSRHRLQFAGKELLRKALGIKPNYRPHVIDATAGFGTDSFVIASLDCEVIMLERSPIVAALLNDGLKRASNDSATALIIQKMRLIQTESIDYLEQLSQKPDVIYLDPMFPDRKKSALVKKEMRALQQLLEPANDEVELLTIALQKAKKRVVVKRPRLAPVIGARKPDIQFNGKSVRFDVYFPQFHADDILRITYCDDA